MNLHYKFVKALPFGFTEKGIYTFWRKPLTKLAYLATQLFAYTRGVQKIRGQMLPFPQFLTELRETCT